jgi:hypothetical protein
MPQITITIDIDDEVGDVGITIDEVQAHGVTFRRNQQEDQGELT